jgi:hypothetical protein
VVENRLLPLNHVGIFYYLFVSGVQIYEVAHFAMFDTEHSGYHNRWSTITRPGCEIYYWTGDSFN